MPYRGEERRRHKRFAVPCPVWLVTNVGADATGNTINVSDGGALVALPRRRLPDCGSLVGVHLRVPRTTPNTYMLEEFTSRARVVRHGVSQDGAARAVGLEFLRPLELALEV